MLAYSQQEVPPALKSHLEAQFAFMSDLSKKMFDGVQKIGQLNIQVAQTLMEETLNSAQQLIQSNSPTDYLSVAASQVQPAAEKLRAYQQHLNNITAGVQVELSKAAEQHVPETTRTAAAVAEEVVRRGAEETDKVTQRQKAAFEKLTKPINDGTNSASQQPNTSQPAQPQAAQQSSAKPQASKPL